MKKKEETAQKSTKEKRIENAVNQIVNWSEKHYYDAMKTSLTDTLDKWLPYFIVKEGNVRISTEDENCDFKSADDLIAKIDIFVNDMFPWQSDEQKRVTREEIVTLIELNRENVDALIKDECSDLVNKYDEEIEEIIEDYEYDLKLRANVQYFEPAIRQLPEFIRRHGIKRIEELKYDFLIKLREELAPDGDMYIIHYFFCAMTEKIFKMDELLKAVNC